jgi:hypothetical protein
MPKMNDASTPLGAKAKLALSRAELLAAMGYHALDDQIGLQVAPNAPTHHSQSRLGAMLDDTVVGQWWRRHPLRDVVELSRPALEGYARRHPARLVAYGAGTGALAIVLRPWKLLSSATVLALLFRYVDVSGMVSRLLDGASRSDAGTIDPRRGRPYLRDSTL